MARSIRKRSPTEAIFSARLPSLGKQGGARRDMNPSTEGELKNRLISEGICMGQTIFHLAATYGCTGERVHKETVMKTSPCPPSVAYPR